MKNGDGGTQTMETNRTEARVAAGRSIISNLIGLIVPVSILVFWFGSPSTRAWMVGFVFGLFGLGDQVIFNAPAAAIDPATTIATETSKPPLTLLGHGCHTEYGYQVCEGEVRNDTADKIDDVVVEVKFKDAKSTFIKAESSLIDYQPLMPGQSSPFKVMSTDNPLIRHYTISFRRMFGGELKAAR